MFKAGIEKVNITPDVNLSGSYRRHWDKKPKGIHDDLFATEIFLSNGSNCILLISLDIPYMTKRFSDTIKEDIFEKAGISTKDILISCTHTHNGPDIFDEEKRCDIRIKDELKNRVVQCAITAVNKSQPAKLGFGDCSIPFSKNRVLTSWSDDSLAFGPVDNICDLLKIEDISGNTLGLFFHYSAHPTCAMGSEFKISRDCVGVAVDRLEKEFNCISAFFQGAAGDVNFCLGDRNFQRATAKGNKMADFIIPAVPSISCTGEVALKSDIQILRMETRIDYDFTINDVLQNIDKMEKRLKDAISNNLPENEIFSIWNGLRVIKWQKLLYEENQVESEIEVIVQSLRIGESLILAIPGEIFIDHQLALRRHFFPDRAMLFGYANGYIGYIPTKHAVASGGYGTVPSYIQRVKPDAGEQMLKAGIKMIEEVRNCN